MLYHCVPRHKSHFWSLSAAISGNWKGGWISQDIQPFSGTWKLFQCLSFSQMKIINDYFHRHSFWKLLIVHFLCTNNGSVSELTLDNHNNAKWIRILRIRNCFCTCYCTKLTFWHLEANYPRLLSQQNWFSFFLRKKLNIHSYLVTSEYNFSFYLLFTVKQKTSSRKTSNL